MNVVSIFTPSEESLSLIPSFLSPVQAGFPSPAEDFCEEKLDLNALVVKRPAATFFVKVEGQSMIDANIYSGDILVVDRSLEAKSGKIVVAVVNGEFTVKRFVINDHGAFLMPENPKFPALKIESNADFQIWGTVTYVIHKT